MCKRGCICARQGIKCGSACQPAGKGIVKVQHAARSEPDCQDTLTVMVKGSTAVLGSWDDDCDGMQQN